MLDLLTLRHLFCRYFTERLQKTPLTLAKVEIPQELGPEEILIKVIAAAQNPADSKVRSSCAGPLLLLLLIFIDVH